MSLKSAIRQNEMRVVVLSPPETVSCEINTLVKLFASGLQNYHIRKPGINRGDLIRYIQKIPPEHRTKLILHSHHDLAHEFEIKGWYFKGQELRPEWGNPALLKSASIHSLSEISREQDECDYLFLSPVFDSISKPGYQSAFDPDSLKTDLQNYCQNPRAIPILGMGGVSPANAGTLKEMGFSGAVLLGAVWQTSPSQGVENFKRVQAELCPQFAY